MAERTDRELLTLAAKAAGIELLWGEVFAQAYIKSLDAAALDEYWCPLDDDGQALRLAVKLALLIDQFPRRTPPAVYVYSPGTSLMLPYGDDQFAATRRAIVRAAAEIGAAS